MSTSNEDKDLTKPAAPLGDVTFPSTVGEVSDTPTQPMPATIVAQGKKRLDNWILTNSLTFFNQEVEEIKNLSLEQVRERIIYWQEKLFSAEAEAERLRTKRNGAAQVFQDKFKLLSETERDRLREEDKQYTSPPKTLVSPLKKSPSKKRAVKSLEESMKSLFGADAEAKLKKLMGE